MKRQFLIMHVILLSIGAILVVSVIMLQARQKTYAILTAFVILAFSSVSLAEFSGCKHDFSDSGWSNGDNCEVCHNACMPYGDVPGAPYWNHEVTTATFTLYSSPTLDAVASQPEGLDRICLSCHDGTVALDSYGGATGSTYIAEWANLGTDLSDMHPVSFVYDSALAQADGGLYDPSTAPSGLGGTITQDLLYDNRLLCASCHNAHDMYDQPGLLVKDNTGSALCATCHMQR